MRGVWIEKEQRPLINALIVVSQLGDQQGAVVAGVSDSMLVVDATRPVASQGMA